MTTLTPVILAFFAMTVALAPFAAYRLAVLAAEDNGPGDRILRWRHVQADKGRITLEDDQSWCTSCATVWVAAPVALALILPPLWPVVWWWGLAGAARWLWLREG